MEENASSGTGGCISAARLKQQHSSVAVDDLVRANLRLGRIRHARHELLVALMDTPCPKLSKRLARLERYERPVRAAQRRFLRRWLKQGYKELA